MGSGRSHSLDRIHHDVQQYLLKLNRIPSYQRQVGVQFAKDIDLAINQFRMQEAQGGSDEVIQADRGRLVLALLEKAPQPMDDLAGTIIFLDDIVKYLSDH